MSGPRFYLVTNRADLVRRFLWCHAKSVPASIAIVEDPFSYTHIPDGAQCRGFWYGQRDHVWAWKGFWDVRRLRGGILGISTEDWERIMAWVDNNRRETLALLYGAETEDASAAGHAAEMGAL